MPIIHENPEDRGLFGMNLIGIALVLALLAAFFLLYGGDLLAFLAMLLRPNPMPIP